jgi:hypothetical protein
MGEAYDKGKAYELHIAKLVRKKADKGSMRNRGSHTASTHDADVFTNLPIHIEAKHHENVRIKDWVEQAEAASNFHETAVVAFRIDDKDYAVLNFEDMLNLFVQIAQMQAEIDDLRAPVEPTVMKPAKAAEIARHEATALANKAVETKKTSAPVRFCKNGHIVDSYGYCMQKGCKYNRTYKPPKKARV